MASVRIPTGYEWKNMFDPESKETLAPCPFCKEPIQVGAIKCKDCNSILVPIAENAGNPVGYSGSPNQSVQIVTNTSEPTERSSGSWVSPTYVNSYLGHGWSIFILSILVFVCVAVWVDDGEIDTAIGLATFSAIVIFPWFIWVVSRPSSNKVLPIIGIIFLFISIIGLFGS
ncbi:hypothetical protein N9748_00715 [bacterium]|jgi:hypothetical protein|nr:hypothetical protein [bacterium]